MIVQKGNIGWDKCRVFDDTHIIQCFKCKVYNYKSLDCKYEKVWIKCHRNHKSKECNQDTINKCINCLRVNNRLNLGNISKLIEYKKEEMWFSDITITTCTQIYKEY